MLLPLLVLYNVFPYSNGLCEGNVSRKFILELGNGLEIILLLEWHQCFHKAIKKS